MNTFTALWLRRGAMALLAAGLAACGGGNGLNGGIGNGPSVNNLSASGVRFNGTLTVTVSGSKLDDPDLFMTVDGPCGPVTRNAGALDYQAVFTCKVSGVGPLSPRVRNGGGLELARLQLNVPNPQVGMTLTQGSRSGNITLELDPTAAPVTVKNFLDYVSSGFYTSTLMHRVVPRLLAEGGGFTTGQTPKAATLPPIVLESNNGLKNLRGTIAMARDDMAVADTATSRFFFNIADNPANDYDSANYLGYAVFGRVVSGLDVLDVLGNVTVVNGAPSPEVSITFMLQTR